MPVRIAAGVEQLTEPDRAKDGCSCRCCQTWWMPPLVVVATRINGIGPWLLPHSHVLRQGR